MSNLNTGEYGQTIYADLGEDITSATNLTFILEPQRGNKQTKTSNVTIGTTNIVVEGETLLANHYLAYVIQDGDLDDPIGTNWRVKGEVTLGTQKIVGDYKKMRILE